MLHPSIRSRIEDLAGGIESLTPVGGGCISNATRLDTRDGRFFLKWATGEAGNTFEAEAAGLRVLREAESGLVIPDALMASDSSESGIPGFILLEWISEGRKSDAASTELGRRLAQLHRYTSDRFGFDIDNFIGRLPQPNGWLTTWPEFFAERRLNYQRSLARERGRWESGWDDRLDRLLIRLPEILPISPEASVVHGDLWGGNYLVTTDGAPSIIDPATHFAHREVDLAMTELFGGFGRRFYDAYFEAWPVESGYEERRDVYNLYHLINHVNHFGSSYAGQVASILRRY